MKKQILIFLTLLIFAATFIISGCDSSSGSNDTNNNNTKNTKAEKQSFNGSIQGDNAPGTVTNEQKESKAKSFGASIGGNILTLWILPDSSAAYTITAIIVTDDNNKLPGSLNVGDDISQPVFISMTKEATIYNSTGVGTITIDQCPASIGDKVSGSFSNIEMANADGSGGKVTLEGKFEVGVASVADNKLVCVATQNTTQDVIDDKTQDTTQGNCDFDESKGCFGPCCDYTNCVAQCALSNCMTDCMSGDAVKCAVCTDKCGTDTCADKLTPECKPKLEAMTKCEADNGCDKIEDSAKQDECGTTYCCAELKAAYQP